MQSAAGKVTPAGPAPDPGGLAWKPTPPPTPPLRYWLRGSGLTHRERSKQVQTQRHKDGGGGRRICCSEEARRQLPVGAVEVYH